MLTRSFKKYLLAGAGSLMLGLGALPANATTVGFDLDGAGATFSKELVDVFQFDATQPYTISVNLGGDNQLGNGDTFSESFRLRLLTTEYPSGTLESSYLASAPTGSYSYIDVALSGSISGYSGGIVTASDFSQLGAAIFDINFGSGSANWYYDSAHNQALTPGSVDGSDSLIASLNLLSGGADNFSFENSSATSKLGVTMQFASGAPDVFFGCPPAPADASACTNDLINEIALGFVFAIGDSSVNLEGLAGDTASDPDQLLITVSDNGTTVRITQVPEPISLVLFGGGLIGLAGAVRRRKA